MCQNICCMLKRIPNLRNPPPSLLGTYECRAWTDEYAGNNTAHVTVQDGGKMALNVPLLVKTQLLFTRNSTKCATFFSFFKTQLLFCGVVVIRW